MDDINSDTSSDSIDNLVTKFKCRVCNRKFTTHYNLMRHTKTMHDDDDDDDDDDETQDSNSNASVTEDSDTSEDETISDNDSTDEDENEKKKSSTVPVMFLKNLIQVLEEHDEELAPVIDRYIQNYMNENEAMKKAVLNNSNAKKRLRHLFINNIAEIEQQRRHPLYRAIMRKAKELECEGFDKSEAINSAGSYRKHAIYNLLRLI